MDDIIKDIKALQELQLQLDVIKAKYSDHFSIGDDPISKVLDDAKQALAEQTIKESKKDRKQLLLDMKAHLLKNKKGDWEADLQEVEMLLDFINGRNLGLVEEEK